MKLRDFVASSLPRVRGRKKKGQPAVSSAAASITAAVAAVATDTSTPQKQQQQQKGEVTSIPTSPPRAVPRQDGNGNWFQFGSESRFAFFEKLVGKESPVKRLFETKTDTRRRQTSPAVPASSREEKKRGKQAVSADGRPCAGSVSGSPTPYGSVDVASPSVLVEKPVFYSHHASPVYGCYRDPVYSERDSCLYHAGYPESVTSYDSTPGSQRGLRSRSRIRTNPWLPSPRPSPYSVRSFSSPYASSRSPSPCSSPAPPSSSDSTSPLTSFSSDVSGTRESQLHRHHRRHRRHHSEIKASELTRQVAADAPLTDTEQYYSTLDSGIGETATSPEEKDKLNITTPKKQRYSSSKRRSSERDAQTLRNISNFVSSSPKSRVKLRPRTRASNSSSKRLVANRDSKFWDSDSSRSPPRSSRSVDSRPLKQSSKDSETGLLGSQRGAPLCASRREDDPDAGASRFITDPLTADFGSDSEEDDSSLLSPCEDICVITSNIEQLAQNISSEYEDSIDVNLDTAHSTSSKPADRCLSLKALYNIDADDGLVLPQKPTSHLRLDLDYATFAEPLRCGQFMDSEQDSFHEVPLNRTLTDSHNSNTEDSLSMVDAAVQTDFVDLDEDEEISGCNSIVHTEGRSDWLGGGSGDWLAGKGSGSATDEEGEEEEDEEERGETEGEEEETSCCEEGGKFWIIPDIMQNSTDTGYSSLSRDGRIVADSDNNNYNNGHAGDTNNGGSASDACTNASNSVELTDTANTAHQNRTGAVSVKGWSNNSSSELEKSDVRPTETTPKSSPSQQENSTRDLPVDDTFEEPREPCVSSTFESKQVHAQKTTHFESKTVLEPFTFKTNGSEYCSCTGEDVSNRTGTREEVGLFDRLRRDADYDTFVPYPYDVTRFDDVMLSRQSNVSPRCDDSFSSRSDSMLSLELRERNARPTFRSSTPWHTSSDSFHSEAFCSCFGTSMTSEKIDVTPNDASFSSFSHERRIVTRQHPRDSPLPSLEDPHRSSATTTSPTGRSLREVRASLEDKVQLLKQGKRVVGRKIREAREEEMMRQQQKLRFQRLLDIHRKRVLLQTLQDLRKRLESQSARLQDSYSAVLDLQKRYV